ncbi:MAG: SciE type virulence protein [Planctomycetes bacterium]|nr:SciE type virulence protein [Planctomycetota bacterium]
MDAASLYRQGDLTQAIEAANAAVKEKPADILRRGFLSELLCISGNLARADAQLEIVTNQQPQAVAGVSLLRQLIRAAQSRQEFFTSGRVPDVLSDPTPVVRDSLAAFAMLRSGDSARAAELLQGVEAARGPLQGRMAGTAFDGMRDLDDLFQGVFEVLTSTGMYYWVPIENVIRLLPRRPERPIDLLWLPVEMSVRDGPDGVVYLPSVYGSTDAADSDAIRLGRETDWDESPEGVVRGRGLRMFLVGDRDLSTLELGDIEFGAEAAGDR